MLCAWLDIALQLVW